MWTSSRGGHGPRLLPFLILTATVALVVLTDWLGPQLAAWTRTGDWPALGFWPAQGALVRAISGTHDPAASYPLALRRQLPVPAIFWTVQTLLVAIELSLITIAGRAMDVRTSRPVSDRRWWRLQGARPRAFACAHTIGELLVDGPDPDRIVIGRYGHPARLLTVQDNVQTLVVAAPRAGKTSGVIIPALLEHVGPCVNTSVRTDVVNHTIGRRRQVGRVWVWDPFGEQTDSWDPLQGCEDWEHALLVARWLGHAMRLAANHSQEYFDQEAEGLTAPLLHAAAIDPGRSVLDVYRWILAREQDEPQRILRRAGAEDALERLGNVYAYTERQRDGIIGTAAVQLKVYGHPAAARTATRRAGVSPELLFAPGHANSAR